MRIVFFIFIFTGFLGCGSNKSSGLQKQQALQKLEALVMSKKFEIAVSTAEPRMSNALVQGLRSNFLPPGSSPSNIFLSGSNILRINNDSIQADLPFYGERFFGGNPGDDSQGIVINDIPENYIVKTNTKKQLVVVNFEIKDRIHVNEWYSVNITLYPSMKGVVFIQSSTRSLIKYTGNLKSIPLTDEVYN